MPNNTILSVGHVIPNSDYQYVDFYSDQSLLDADIIIFSPNIRGYDTDYTNPTYNGLPNLDERSSRKLKDAISHWRAELTTALQNGKTVILVLCPYQEVYVETGETKVSGTGRNARSTTIVNLVSNYSCIPLALGKIVPRRGSKIKTNGDLGILSSYWKEFSELSSYELYLDSLSPTGCLVTNTGGKTVGGVYTHGGNSVLLPYLNFNKEEFWLDEDNDDDQDEGKEDRGEDEEDYWNKFALSRGSRFIQLIVGMDDALRSATPRSVAPDWALEARYSTQAGEKLKAEISDIDAKLTELNKLKAQVIAHHQDEERIRNLLFEKGPALEDAVLRALRDLKFEATTFRDGNNQYDAVFTSEEGRFIGEIEGKDRKAIDNTKLRQLEQNLQEDFATDGTDEFAIGVLFGNADRLTAPHARGAFFTEKCLKAASRGGISLIRTTDLFEVSRYIRDTGNLDFAKLCREAIMKYRGGIVQFPAIPTLKTGTP